MTWSSCAEIRTWFTEIVPVSVSKAIIKIRPDVTLERIKLLFSAYNQSHEACIRKLQAFDGRAIWTEQARAPPSRAHAQPSASIELCLKNASSKNDRELVAVVLSSAQNSMTQEGFDFATSGITADWAAMKRKRAGPIQVTFPNLTVARAFHNKFKDDEWESDDGTQTIIVHLKHEVFDQELCKPHVRRAISNVSAITPALIKSIGSGISN